MQEEESSKKKDFVKDLGTSFKNEMSKEGLAKNLKKWKNDIVVFISTLKKVRDIVKNNYELGKKHYDLGNFDDAVFRFKFLTWMDTKHADGWYWLGASYIAQDKKQNAKIALKRALEIRPNFQEARDMLKVASGDA
jgi:tetratricopeptide (TPR) repeat protein